MKVEEKIRVKQFEDSQAILILLQVLYNWTITSELVLEANFMNLVISELHKQKSKYRTSSSLGFQDEPSAREADSSDRTDKPEYLQHAVIIFHDNKA